MCVDRDVLMRGLRVQSCVSGHIPGAVGRSKMTSDSVRPGGGGRRLGKTFYMAVLGGGWMDVAAGAVGKHPLPIPSSLEWFVLFMLCQPGRVGEVESELDGRS